MRRRNRIGGFRSPEERATYLAAYDALVDLWPVPHEEIDVPTRYGMTHARRSGSGDGPALVLLHPTMVSSGSGYRLVAPLARRHTVYFLDTIGTPGRSVQTKAIRQPKDIAGWLDDTLSALDLARVHLTGYSEGGWVALWAAMWCSDRLASLALLEPGGALYRVRPAVLVKMLGSGLRVMARRGSPERTMVNFSKWLSPNTELTEPELQLVVAAIKGYRQRLPLPRVLTDEQLSSISIPTLVMLGAQTVLYDAHSAAARAEAFLPRCEVEVISGAGHDLPLVKPDVVIGRVLEFVGRHT